MAVAAETLSRLIDGIYAAAIEPQRWTAAMAEIGDSFGSPLGGLFVQDRATGAFPLVVQDPRTPTEIGAQYTAHYGAIDPMREIARREAVGVVLTEDAALEDVAVRRSECYNDFYLRLDLPHWVGTYVVKNDRYEGSLVVYGNGGHGPFSPDEVHLMRLLVPHLSRAVEIGLRLGGAAASQTALAGALDSLASGVIVVDRAGRVSWANRRAGEILRRGDGLTLARGELVGTTSSATAKVRRLVAQALAPAEEGPGHLSVERSTGGTYTLVAAPLGSEPRADLPSTAAAMVLVGDPAAERPQLARQLRRLYGLTPAETALALGLLAGNTLQETADARRTTIETARGQLKQVLRKTGARRQAELMAVVLGSPASLLRE